MPAGWSRDQLCLAWQRHSLPGSCTVWAGPEGLCPVCPAVPTASLSQRGRILAESRRITRQQWCPRPHAYTPVQCTLCSNVTALLMQPELAGWERYILSQGCQEVSPQELKVLQLEQDPSQTPLQHRTSSHIPQISMWGLWEEALLERQQGEQLSRIQLLWLVGVGFLH